MDRSRKRIPFRNSLVVGIAIHDNKTSDDGGDVALKNEKFNTCLSQTNGSNESLRQVLSFNNARLLVRMA
jgi:hypothetical protein